MTRVRLRAVAPIAGALAAVCALSTLAMIQPRPAAAAENNAPADKPFADHHLVLQLSDDDAKKQSLVISVAYNLLKFYGPDKIAIEVVTFGPGIALLRSDSPNRTLVDSLVAQGVKFDVCMNTVETDRAGNRTPRAAQPECQAGRSRRRANSRPH